MSNWEVHTLLAFTYLSVYLNFELKRDIAINEGGLLCSDGVEQPRGNIASCRDTVPGKTVGLKLLKLFRELIVGGTNFSSKLEKEIHSKKKEMEKIQLRNKVTVFIETSRYWEKFSSKQVHIEENEN